MRVLIINLIAILSYLIPNLSTINDLYHDLLNEGITDVKMMGVNGFQYMHLSKKKADNKRTCYTKGVCFLP